MFAFFPPLIETQCPLTSLLSWSLLNTQQVWALGSHSHIAVGQEVRETWRSWSGDQAVELGLFAWQWEIPSGSESKRRPSAQHSYKNYIILWLCGLHARNAALKTLQKIYRSLFFFIWSDLQVNLCSFKCSSMFKYLDLWMIDPKVLTLFSRKKNKNSPSRPQHTCKSWNVNLADCSGL